MSTLVAVSHGTASTAGTAAVSRLVRAVARVLPGPVTEAYVDVHGPYVADVVAGRGGEVAVVPLLLAAGYHVHVDVARAVAPWPAASVARVLGPDPRLTAVLVDRLREAGARPDDVLLLAAAGSSDERADASVRAVAADLSAAWGSRVQVAYGAARSPRVACAVARARLEHPGRRVVLASYLLAPGHFHWRLLTAGADLVSAPLLEPDRVPDPRLVDLVVARFLDATPGAGLERRRSWYMLE